MGVDIAKPGSDGTGVFINGRIVNAKPADIPAQVFLIRVFFDSPPSDKE
jgi:hypothetical protein